MVQAWPIAIFIPRDKRYLLVKQLAGAKVDLDWDNHDGSGLSRKLKIVGVGVLV